MKNRGQFFTPKEVANRMVTGSIKYLNKKNFEALDPCFGKGIFLKSLFSKKGIDINLDGYEIEKNFYQSVKKEFDKKGTSLKIFNRDYLTANIKKKFDYIIINPPYVRHEILNKNYKNRLIENFEKKFSVILDKKSNLYVYFILKAILDLKMGGICTVIVYDAIDQTKYGKNLLTILENNCTIIKSFKLKTPFKKVLIDAKVIIFKKVPKKNIKKKDILKKVGFTDLENLIQVKRGIGLASKKVFVAKKNDNYFKLSSKIILKPREIDKDSKKIEPSSAYVFSPVDKIPKILKVELQDKYQKIYNKKLKSIFHSKKSGPIIFNYFYRNNISFYENKKNLLISDNFYILKSKILNQKALMIILNSKKFREKVLKNSRSQGSGLFKIQIYEFKNILMPDWSKLSILELKKLEKQIILNSGDDLFLKKIIERPILNEATQIY